MCRSKLKRFSQDTAGHAERCGLARDSAKKLGRDGRWLRRTSAGIPAAVFSVMSWGSGAAALDVEKWSTCSADMNRCRRASSELAMTIEISCIFFCRVARSILRSMELEAITSMKLRRDAQRLAHSDGQLTDRRVTNVEQKGKRCKMLVFPAFHVGQSAEGGADGHRGSEVRAHR